MPGQREPERREVLGEDRDDVDAHQTSSSKPGSVVDDDAATGYVDLGDQRGHEREQHLALRRTDHEQVLGGVVLDALQLADDLTVGGLDPQPDELVVVELLGVLRSLVRVDGDGQLGAPGRLGGGPVGDLLEAHHEPAGVGARSRPRSGTRRPVCSVAPGAKRRSGSSVRGSTNTSPWSPWAGPIRPTTT